MSSLPFKNQMREAMPRGHNAKDVRHNLEPLQTHLGFAVSTSDFILSSTYRIRNVCSSAGPYQSEARR